MKKRGNNLNVYLILADENLFHPHYLSGLIRLFANKKIKIVGITIAQDSFRRGLIHAVLQQYILWGTFAFVFIVLNSLIRSFLSRLGISDNTITGISRKHKIPLFVTKSVNSGDHLGYLSSLAVDIIISSNGQIFKKELLDLPKIACINRHSALLPKYGGVLPVFWAMKNNEEMIGVSAHYMVEKIDQGSILASASFKNDKENSLFYNYVLAFDISADVTVVAIDNALKGKIVKKFKHNKDEYYSFPKERDMEDFKKINKTFSLGDVVKYYKMYAN